jgi:LacI family transcriptional regulator
MKRFGVRDVARIAKVSIGTVDRALNGRDGINEDTRKRILDIASEHGYTPNLSARALSFSRSSVRIGLCIPREINYFYDPLRSGVMDEAQRYAHLGIEMLYQPFKKLNSPASRPFQQLLNSGIQALIFTPGSAHDVVPLIEKAEKVYNIRVVCVASDDSPSCRSTAISVNPSINGAMAAELMAKIVPVRSDVGVVTGMLYTEEHRRKVEGFEKNFPLENGGRTLTPIEGHEEPQELYLKTLQLLRKHKNLAGIYVSTVNCIPVCKAVEEQNRSGVIKIIATDLFAELEPYFQRGTLSASIYQNPYRQGQLAVRTIVDHFLNGKAFPSIHYLNPVIALRTNLGLFREMRRPAAALLDATE